MAVATPNRLRSRSGKLRLTEEEFAVWWDEDTRAAFVGGEVILLSPESVVDERIRWFIGSVLGIYVTHRGVGEVFGPNLQARLRVELRRMPDLVFVAQASAHPLHESYLEGAPDLVMEIVSPDSVARDDCEKYLEDERAGVRECWIVDLQSKRVEFYGLEQGRYIAQKQKRGAYHSKAGGVRGVVICAFSSSAGRGF
ncbi:MAG: Uma2 family endonuclease [Abditibacteriales bacterium]|nr:Uma2 family endonuclease [Abditibacteriales bacterium]MDW8364467.1 Uma2 family endonuclease [Abditibacteriales bacterium]